MMIGGEDVVIPTTSRANAMEACLRVALRYWPNAILDDANSEDRFLHFEDVPIGRLDEMLVYQNEHFANEWDKHGAIPEIDSTMLHFLVSNDSLTVVVGNLTDELNLRILESIRSAVKNLSAMPTVLSRPGREAA